MNGEDTDMYVGAMSHCDAMHAQTRESIRATKCNSQVCAWLLCILLDGAPANRGKVKSMPTLHRNHDAGCLKWRIYMVFGKALLTEGPMSLMPLRRHIVYLCSRGSSWVFLHFVGSVSCRYRIMSIFVICRFTAVNVKSKSEMCNVKCRSSRPFYS